MVQSTRRTLQNSPSTGGELVMDRESVEKVLQDFGFEAHEEEDTLIYSYKKDSYDDLNININEETLYVCKANYVRFDVDGWGLCIRLYYEYYYIGCIVHGYDEITSFTLEAA